MSTSFHQVSFFVQSTCLPASFPNFCNSWKGWMKVIAFVALRAEVIHCQLAIARQCTHPHGTNLSGHDNDGRADVSKRLCAQRAVIQIQLVHEFCGATQNATDRVGVAWCQRNIAEVDARRKFRCQRVCEVIVVAFSNIDHDVDQLLPLCYVCTLRSHKCQRYYSRSIALGQVRVSIVLNRFHGEICN